MSLRKLLGGGSSLPAGWEITGYGPVGEGVEATGPGGFKVVAPVEEDLFGAIYAHSTECQLTKK